MSHPWVFFDVGNALLNEDPAFAEVYKHLLRAFHEEGLEVTFEELLEEREGILSRREHYAPFVPQAQSRLGEDGFKQLAKRYRTDLYQRWYDVHPPIVGMLELVETLSNRDISLGIIADQPTVTKEVLERLDILKHFKVLGLSDLVGHKKPNTSFFEWALQEADCPPENAIMIGDRIDNDIIPGNAVGMTTVWMPINAQHKGDWYRMDEFDKAYLASAARQNGSYAEPTAPEQQPNVTARSFDELRDAVLSLVDELSRRR